MKLDDILSFTLFYFTLLCVVYASINSVNVYTQNEVLNLSCFHTFSYQNNF